MEEPVEGKTVETKSLLYSIQLKAVEIAESLRIQTNRISENDIKVLAHQNLNLFYMTEKVFEAVQAKQLFELSKTLTLNYNSLLVILLDMCHKQTQKIFSMQKNSMDKTLSRLTSEKPDSSTDMLTGPARPPKLGGIHLYNESYGRCLEDQRILQQLKIEKEQGIRRRKQELIQTIIFQELNQATDEEEPSSNDEVGNFILQTKKKGSIFNYIPYEAQLQDILEYFHKAQNEANQFLVQKEKAQSKSSNNPNRFSFSQIQREVQAGKIRLRKEVAEKLKNFIDRFRQRQHQLEVQLQEKEAHAQLSLVKEQICISQSVQTDLDLDQMIRLSALEKKEHELTCLALEHLKSTEAEGASRQNNLKYEISLKKKDLEKLQKQKKELQSSISSLKQMINKQKHQNQSPSHQSQTPESIKQIDLKAQPHSPQLQKTITHAQHKQTKTNEDQVYENLSHHPTSKKFGKTFGATEWARKLSNESIPLALQNTDAPQPESLTRTHLSVKKFARYIVDNPKPEPLKIEIEPLPEFEDACQIKAGCIELGIQTEQMTMRQVEEGQQKQRAGVVAQSGQHEPQVSSLTSLATIEKDQRQVQTKRVPNAKSSKPTSSQKRPTKLEPKLRAKDATILKPMNQLKSPQAGQITVKKEQTELHQHSLVKDLTSPVNGRWQSYQQVTSKPEDVVTLPESKSEPIRLNNSEENQVGEHIVEQKDRALEVVQEVAEEDPESHKSALRQSQPNSCLQSPSELLSVSESVSNVIAQLKLMKQKRNKLSLTSYSITVPPTPHLITPFRQLKNTLRDGSNKFSQKNASAQSKLSDKHTLSKQSTLPSHPTPRNNSTLLIPPNPFSEQNQLLSNYLPGVSASGNQQNRGALKALKKKVLEEFKSGKISLQEVQNIVSVVSLSGPPDNIPLKSSGTLSPWQGVSHRHSLPLLDLKQALPRNPDTFHHHARHSSYSGQTKEEEHQTIEEEYQLSQYLNHSKIQGKLKSRFRAQHKNCKEGPVCSHVLKYIETIMKQMDAQRQREKQSLTLHIENIGKKMEEPDFLLRGFGDEMGGAKQTSKENRQQLKGRGGGMAYTKRSLQKVRNSKMLELPAIRSPKVVD